MQGRHKKTETDLTIEERICLHSFFVDPGTLDEAYHLCHQGSKATGDYIHVMALRWVRKGSPQRAYLDSLNKKLVIVGRKDKNGSPDKSAESDYIDFSQKDNVIMALSKSANEEPDSLKRTKILATIADLQRMKQDENKDDKELIHFYLPLTCKRCNLYCAEMERRKKK
jgi:hypothetical protein